MSSVVNLGAPDLFGNQVAEDEEEDVFSAYAVARDEVEAFADPQRRLCFARAYKGEGKSALLRLSGLRIARQETAPLIIKGPATALAPSLETDDFDTWVRAWKAALFGRIAQEVGSRIGFAWKDDAMSLVEEAEKGGTRDRGIVSSVLERLGLKMTAGGFSLDATPKKPGAASHEATVARWATGREAIWVIVDDVDQAFENTAKYRAKVASFFVACRQAANAVPELRVRAAVRPNVWTTIKMQAEPLSHVEQYVTDLVWDEDSIRRLLARRVEGYLVRRSLWPEVASSLPTDIKQRERALIALVFEDPVQWGKAEKGEPPAARPPHVMLYTLSKHRPRWLIELCSVAAKAASKDNASRIRRAHVLDQLDDFGRKRIADTVAEFRSQCPQIEELISAFRHAPEEMATADLLTLIENKILNHLTPTISGVVGRPTGLDVGSFLFEIGLFYGRQDFANGSYQHVTYSDRPSLLKSRAAVDDGLRWEVHPVFRQALEIRDAAGREPSRRIVRPQAK